MALLSVIRRWHFREHLSIREIGRRTGLSRNTIRKYLGSDSVEPQFKVPDRPSKLDPFADRLAAWLKTEANKPRKQKRTLKQLHADLLSLGFVTVPRFLVQSEGEYPAFIRPLGRPQQQHILAASASQAMCEDGSRYSLAAKPRSSSWRRPATGPRGTPGRARRVRAAAQASELF